MQERSPRGHRARTVNYVPGEVCIVGSMNRPLPDEDVAAQHAALQMWLNRRLQAALRVPSTRPRSPFERDLAPTRLRRILSKDDSLAILTDVYRPGGRGGKGLDRPWLSLPPSTDQQSGPTTVLHFYALDVPPADRTDVVREIVNWISRFIVGRDRGEDPPPVQVVAATPNWLSAGTQHSAAGPAARPEPAPDGKWEFELGPRYAELLKRAEQAAEPVTVVVLDTSPTPEQVEAAATSHPDNPLLQRVTGRPDPSQVIAVGAAPSLPPEYFAPDLPYLANWDRELTRRLPDHAFLMPDHGLFAAGIIRQIAPRSSPIRLVRVLSDYGVGDLFGLLSVLRQVPDTLAGGRLILNMSLVVDIPPSEQLLELWFPEASKDHTQLLPRWNDVCTILDNLHHALRDAIQWLNARGILVVAAAGNDNVRRTTRPEPRLPARYDDVLGVAALSVDRGAAAYSNRGDIIVMGNGVAALGGNAQPDAADPQHSPAVINLQPPVDALVGLYSQPGFPLSDHAPANRSGWAYWVGTSFAAPIVAGIAATYWAADPAATSREVLDAVIAQFASPSSVTGLDCPALEVGQSP